MRFLVILVSNTKVNRVKTVWINLQGLQCLSLNDETITGHF